jgi:sulfur carrier protein
VRVRINGQDRDIPDGSTIARLLQDMDAPPQRVAVEVNRELVTRSRFGQTTLNEGDAIEIVTLVGGG